MSSMVMRKVVAGAVPRLSLARCVRQTTCWVSGKSALLPIGSSPSRAFRSTSPASGIFDGILDPMKKSWDNSKADLQEQKELEAFRFQIGFLVKKEKFLLEDFMESIREVAEASGFKGWRKMIPGVSTHPVVLEIQLQQKIWEHVPKNLREDANLIKANEKAKIARESGTSVEAVNKFLKRYNEMKMMHTWLRKRAIAGKPLPQTAGDMQRMALEPDSGISRKTKF